VALLQLTTDLFAEATGRRRRADAVVPGGGGPAGNARLTAAIGPPGVRSAADAAPGAVARTGRPVPEPGQRARPSAGKCSAPRLAISS
jgi:hypothetical protein